MDPLEVTCHFPSIAEDATELLIVEYQSQNLPIPDMRHVRGDNNLDSRNRYSGELGRIIGAINTVYQRAMSHLFPERQDVASSLYGEELCRIIGGVKYALTMVPIDEKDEDGKLNCYELFTLEETDLPSPTEEQVHHYQALEDLITRMLDARYQLLEKFFKSESIDDKVELGRGIDSCIAELGASRYERIKLCHQLCIEDDLVRRVTVSSDLENAVDWNQKQKQNKMLNRFHLSRIEKKLIKHVQGGFSKYDWPYFTFHFTTREERLDVSDRDRYSGDILRMNQLIYERKMYIAYHACKSNSVRSYSDFDVHSTDIVLLLQEIDMYRKKVESGSIA